MDILIRISISTILQGLLSGIALMVYLFFSYNTALSDLNYYSMLYIIPSIVFALIMLLVNNKHRFSWQLTKSKLMRLIIRTAIWMAMGLVGIGLAVGTGLLIKAYSLDIGALYMLTDGSFYFWALIPSGAYALFEFLMVSD